MAIVFAIWTREPYPTYVAGAIDDYTNKIEEITAYATHMIGSDLIGFTFTKEGVDGYIAAENVRHIIPYDNS